MGLDANDSELEASVSALYERGFELFSSGQLAEAQTVCEQALGISPNHAGSLILFTLITAARASEAGDFNQAVAKYNLLITVIPGNANLHVNLGVALHGLGRFDEAIAAFTKAIEIEPAQTVARKNIAQVLADQKQIALAQTPKAPVGSFAEAVALQQAGRNAEAETIYRAILQQDPNNVSVMNNLGLIVPREEAETLYKAAIAISPNDINSHLNLGVNYQAQSKYVEAALEFRYILDRLDPNSVSALSSLGNMYASLRVYDQASIWYRRLLEIDPDNQMGNRNIVSVLEGESRLEEAEIYRKRIHRPFALTVEKSDTPRRTVLVPLSIGTGGVGYHDLIPLTRNNRVIWNVEFSTDEQEANLPAYDLVFNAIGNAEIMAPAMPNFEAFMGRCPCKVLNPPDRVARTQRDLMPALLGSIPNVFVPNVVKLTKAEIATDLHGHLAKAKIAYPFLTRPITGQEGRGLTLINGQEDEQAVDFSIADAYYFIAFYDYKNQDGFYRKYRTVFVDRKPHHYHLAISPRWLVHYFSADMLAEPWKRDEEKRFFEDPQATLGAAAVEALSEIGRAMDMDYAGIDYTILPDGRILVFEANATMTVALPNENDFPYKQAPVHAIFNAFEDMMAKYETKRV